LQADVVLAYARKHPPNGEIVIQTSMLELSPAARRRVLALFREEDVPRAERTLAQCTDNPFLIADVMRQGPDRIVFAMIRLSSGRLDRLESIAIPLFRQDWRDLLCAAEFAEDVHAHESWEPRRLDEGLAERWLQGDRSTGMEFCLGDTVEVLTGLNRGKRGTVVNLIGLEPEELYVVDLGSGKREEYYQRVLLGRAG
jgi:hypothetical protein